uniref:Predicted protein n=1 Tax=Physcomitrium patens TaxID=3218 RepID=A9U452_PHYPA
MSGPGFYYYSDPRPFHSFQPLHSDGSLDYWFYPNKDLLKYPIEEPKKDNKKDDKKDDKKDAEKKDGKDDKKPKTVFLDNRIKGTPMLRKVCPQNEQKTREYGWCAEACDLRPVPDEGDSDRHCETGGCPEDRTEDEEGRCDVAPEEHCRALWWMTSSACHLDAAPRTFSVTAELGTGWRRRLICSGANHDAGFMIPWAVCVSRRRLKDTVWRTHEKQKHVLLLADVDVVG